MAWTTPGTAVAGAVLEADFWNSNVRDNTAYLKAEADAVGLVLITSQALPSAGIRLDDVFTSDYDVYKLVFYATHSAVSTTRLRLSLAGVPNAGALSYFRRILTWTSAVSSATVSQAQAFTNVNTTAGGLSAFTSMIYGPALARETFIFTSADDDGSGGSRLEFVRHSVATAYDGIEIVPNTGTYTAGRVSVYGLRQ